MNAINLWNVLRIGGKKIERTLCLPGTFYNSSIFNQRLWGTPVGDLSFNNKDFQKCRRAYDKISNSNYINI